MTIASTTTTAASAWKPKQRQAKQALSQFFGFIRHTFVSGLEIGRNLRQLLHQLCLERGLTQGDRLFDRWLDSSDCGGST
ncbi:hypothetical protein [Phormidium sp. CCY1219]|uniref:hypothetical protein n=1 Tax=Phormidium sp. CCY1219 TaxID=2886104 RepID=UPI002D1F10D9|nr:hypothetical protein [Phormidium sp. CCY1219]MEB3828858.1 hypothetical protein [Phormidium sp. CCY1219]